MNIIEKILYSENFIKELRIYALKTYEMKDNKRYFIECGVLSLIAKYALNKPKNINKPNFEDVKLEDIFEHLKSEILELQHELISEEIIWKRVLEEIGDCAALLVGLVVWIIEHKDKK